MRYGSVCSGIEAATVAWHPLGWRASFVSEIEAFPRAVLQHRWPEIPLHGDFTTIQAGEYEPIDLLVGGTPCQSFSVAGLRGGLGDDRGNLALEYLRLADRLRPRWLVWENVPGVLSSAGGRDFGAILGGMVELGYGVAYRVLDAQFFGVAQRRRRVFVVGHLGDWRRAAAVLFERDGLSGHSPPSREAGEGAAGALAGGARQRGGFSHDDIPLAPTLGAGGHSRNRLDEPQVFDLAQITSAANRTRSEPGLPAGTLAVQGRPHVAYSIMPQNSGKDYKAREVEVAQPIMAGGPVGGNQGGDYIVTPINADALRGEGVAKSPSPDAAGRVRLRDPGLGIGDEGDPAGTLAAAGPGAVAISFALRGREGGAMPELGGDQVGALRAASGGSSRDYVAFNARQDPTHGPVADPLGTKDNGHGLLLPSSAVRRLTPRECERLQGFPDDYTLIPWRKGEASDGPRYKALGNSMAVPVMRWIGERIAAVEALSAEQEAA